MIEGIKVETVHNLSGQFRKENVENVAKSTIATGIAEIDAALGGGLTPGSILRSNTITWKIHTCIANGAKSLKMTINYE